MSITIHETHVPKWVKEISEVANWGYIWVERLPFDLPAGIFC